VFTSSDLGVHAPPIEQEPSWVTLVRLTWVTPVDLGKDRPIDGGNSSSLISIGPNSSLVAE
jgi:hypothetical protein